MKIAQSIIDSINKLFERAPYFSIRALREYIAGQKLSYAPDTIKVYLSQLRKEGVVFSAGRGWYSSIAEPYRLDTAPVEKLAGELKEAFPLLDFACWSTSQLNEMLRHQLAKHVQFAYVERDAIDSVAEGLRSKGYFVCANPGKLEIQRSFFIEENTVVVLPLTSESPHQDGFADIEKVMVDVLADASAFSIINVAEFSEGASTLMRKYRVDISMLDRYSIRRKTNISNLLNNTLIN